MFRLFLSKTAILSFVTTVICYFIIRPFVDSLCLVLAVSLFSGIVFRLGLILNEKTRKEQKSRASESPTTKGGAK
jgi:hypothetical protein